MPHNLNLVQKIFELVKNVVSIVLLIAIFYILQYIFDMHFLCSCISGLHTNGVLYMLLPPLILTFIVNILEPFRQRKIFFSMHCLSWEGGVGCFGSYVLKVVLKYISLTAVWITTVLFDGDWYFCLMTNLNSTQTGIPCQKNLTYQEQRLRDKYMTESLDYGLYVICCFLFFWSVYELRRVYFRSRHQSCCPPYYSVVFEDLLAEEVSSHLNNELKEIAEQKAKALCQPYLQAIRNQELLEQNETENINSRISDVWKKISASGFYLKEDER